jgi:hypothetical protein
MADFDIVDLSEQTPDRLAIMLDMQDDLERLTTGHSFRALVEEDEGDEIPEDGTRSLRITQFKEMVMAGWREGVEQLDEIGSKPWATSEHWNGEAVKKELVDEWHFFMAKCLLAGLTAEELFRMYWEKWKVNVARQRDGYDGVTTKCPKCKRALDDSGSKQKCVPETTSSESEGDAWCQDAGYYWKGELDGTK